MSNVSDILEILPVLFKCIEVEAVKIYFGRCLHLAIFSINQVKWMARI